MRTSAASACCFGRYVLIRLVARGKRFDRIGLPVE
jgi:hypothetical protein